MTDHTPGPWARNISPKYPVYAEADHAKIAIALVGGQHGVSEEQAMANLKLIAAAPDLLKALITLEAQAGRLDEFSDEWDQTRAAIAKATQ